MADHRFTHSCRRDHIHINSHSSCSSSSFSSTLLEEIYRSIDKVGDDVGDSMRKKRDDAATRFLLNFKTDEEIANYQRACMIERWMDKEKKPVTRPRSTPDLQEKLSSKDRQCSSSSSSDSSSGGHRAGSFSSFELESLPVHPPKPVRTAKLGLEKDKAINIENSGINRCNWQGFNDGSEQKQKQKQKSESKFVKTKSKALKLYDDLKKVKQPISPGGKVAAFLNSLFTAGNVKKSKISAADSASLKSTAITCASASSFSRSCLSRTTAKSAPTAKRSVRFFPASVILDEDCRRKSLRHNNHGDADVDLILTAIDEELAMHARKKDQIGIYEFEHSFDIIRDRNRDFDGEFDEEDDEFDGASCASSDLFELENLSVIGTEELPVYETTHLQNILQTD